MRNFVKKLYLLSSAVILLAAAGCRTAMTEDGRSCYGITGEEETALITSAKKSLAKNRTLVSASEYSNHIANAMPEVKISYTGDRYGTVKIEWKLPRCIIAVTFSGELMTNQMICSAAAQDIYDENYIIFQNVPGK